MSFWPLENPLFTFPIAGKSAESWCEAGVLSQSDLEISYPWQLLELHAKVLASLEQPKGATEARLAEGASLWVGEGTSVLPGVYVEGPVVSGKNCKIGPNCYLRGPISIGDTCHIGQAVELKNTLVGNGTNVGHLSYVGDSILADKVNFGAGTITSNLRHDGATTRSSVGGELQDTGRRKLGTIVGAEVHTGVHTSILPGRKLGPATTTYPGEVVATDKSR